jgi:hypothetical protein
MKAIIDFCMLVASLFVITVMPVKAAYIKVISQSCNTDGYTYFYDEDLDDFIAFDWNESGNTSAFATGPFGDIVGLATIMVGESTVFFENWTAIIDSGIAHTQVIFQPIGASSIKLDDIHADSSGLAYPKLTLTDYTTNETLFWLSVYNGGFDLNQSFPGLMPNGSYWTHGSTYGLWDPDSGEYIGSYQYPLASGLIPVDSSHTYLLNGLVDVIGWDEGALTAKMSLVAVPEPTTLLLLGLGLLGLTTCRRKFKKQFSIRLSKSRRGVGRLLFRFRKKALKAA